MKISKFIYLILVSISILNLTCCEQKKITSQQKEISDKGYKDTLIMINKYLIKQDDERIEAYIKRHDKNMQITESGLRFEILKKGTGEIARKGLIAKMNYKIELLDGTLCYSSDSTGVKIFKIGQGGVESGLEEALLLMRVGDEATLIMPPYLAHGLIGDMKKIPARATIVYHVELLSITKN